MTNIFLQVANRIQNIESTFVSFPCPDELIDYMKSETMTRDVTWMVPGRRLSRLYPRGITGHGFGFVFDKRRRMSNKWSNISSQGKQGVMVSRLVCTWTLYDPLKQATTQSTSLFPDWWNEPDFVKMNELILLRFHLTPAQFETMTQ